MFSVQGAYAESVRMQHQASDIAEASSSGVEGLTPCTTCIYISRQTAVHAMLADADLVLVSKLQAG